MILGEARLYIRNAPWMMFLPGMALTVTVLALEPPGGRHPRLAGSAASEDDVDRLLKKAHLR